jgi:hypothetical protein
MDTTSGHHNPIGLNTTAADQAQKAMGDRPTNVTNKPLAREGQSQLTLQWFGDQGPYHVQRLDFLSNLT